MMFRLTAATLTLTLLAACGADGPPTAPTRAETSIGSTTVGLSGEARIGVQKRID